MRTSRVLIAVLVVVVIVLAYFAIVGFASAESDLNDPGDDPTDGDREPTAYGVIHVSVMCDNAVDRYTGEITDAYVSVYDYLSFDEGRVYSNEKLDLLGILSDDMTAWVTVKITGPGQFIIEWESDHIDFSLSEWGHEYLDFTSGRVFFWDKGTYSMTVTEHVSGESGDYDVDTASVSFTVGV